MQKSNYLILLLIGLFVIVCCKSDDEPEANNVLVGNYISEVGALGLGSGDSLIITNNEIRFLDGERAFDSNNQPYYIYSQPWTVMNYEILTDSTLALESNGFSWGDDLIMTYRINTDTIDRACQLSDNAIYLDFYDCSFYAYQCCAIEWKIVND